ncbi:hypothetical protein LNO12_14640 [Klebsiella pneumoniae subsp. pneumoniae]|nr:hypothetical protein [Klebsiella pneumoniae subsp. pneumoniae]
MFAGKKSAQIREILISESAWEEMTCLFAPSLSNVPVSLKFDLVDDTNAIVSHWAEEMNKSLTSPKGDGKVDESVYHQYVDISAQAQLMRYSHGAGASAEYNPSEKNLREKLKVMPVLHWGRRRPKRPCTCRTG